MAIETAERGWGSRAARHRRPCLADWTEPERMTWWGRRGGRPLFEADLSPAGPFATSCDPRMGRT